MECDETMLSCPFCGSDASISYYCDSVLVHCCECKEYDKRGCKAACYRKMEQED